MAAPDATSPDAARLARDDPAGRAPGRTDAEILSSYGNLDELAAPAQVQEQDSALEDRRADGHHGELEHRREGQKRAALSDSTRTSRFKTGLYTHAYLVLFSIWGTLARIGLGALTFYPGAPDVYGVLWANFTGSLIMGFLSEERALFRAHAQDRDYVTARKTVPLFLGLTAGFCGCLTSFSSFMRDTFLALSNDLPNPTTDERSIPRSPGDSVMATLAVIIVTVSVSLAALHFGSHLAMLVSPAAPALPHRLTRVLFDRIALFVGFGSWLGAVVMCILPPDRSASAGVGDAPMEAWRGKALFAAAVAPVGCLARFHISLALNGRMASFPLGTFTVNILGTLVLGVAWDLQHSPLGHPSGLGGGSQLACQFLQGVQDGLCGSITTVSTWVLELSALRRRHAYVYGAASIFLGLSLLIVITGSLRWTHGFSTPACMT